MTRVLVLGATGMLGHKMVQVLARQADTWATARSASPVLREALPIAPERLLEGVTASSPASIVQAIDDARPDVVVNCIGIVKQARAATDWGESVAVNGMLPHALAALGRKKGFHLIHVGTDCVFSGRKGRYTESDVPDAQDVYGQSKLVGEVAGKGCLTLRTSIIGRELGADTHGLVEWFLAQRGRVRGFRGAVFSGLPTVTLAELVSSLTEREPRLSGLYHVSAAPIDKCTLLTMLRNAWSSPVEIDAVDEPRLDRSLDSTAFRQATGWSPPSWPSLVDRLFQDARPYAGLRNRP